MPDIILHQWEISPFCGKVRKALRRKNLTYQTIDYNGLLATRAGRLSGSGKLPVLDYDGTRIQDSSDIVAFLETRHPEPALYPTDPQSAQKQLYWRIGPTNPFTGTKCIYAYAIQKSCPRP